MANYSGFTEARGDGGAALAHTGSLHTCAPTFSQITTIPTHYFFYRSDMLVVLMVIVIITLH